MDLGTNGEETMDAFINDLVATFNLTSPTIIFDNEDDIPEICYASHWVLCLPSKQHERDLKELADNIGSSRELKSDGMHI